MSSQFRKPVFATAIRLIFGSLVLCLASSGTHACKTGSPVDIKDVLLGKQLPAGKTLCRNFGNIILVPSVSYPVDRPDPGCDGAVIVKPEDKVMKDALQDIGGVLLVFGNKDGSGVTQSVGLVMVALSAVYPTQKTQSNANCGVSYLILGPGQEPLHWAAFYGNNDEIWSTHPVDEPSFYKGDAGEGNYMVQKAKPVGMNDGRTMYSILFKNWATDSRYYRHVRIMIDTVE